ncbi:MAG: hypothetical protein NT150_02260 [Bacteroidetes bacterium]|nr:hypothetical protein [Bacteroidota bacterium]
MKVKTTSSLMLASALMMTLTYSCKKDREVAYDDLPEATSVESSDDNSTSDEMYTHVYTVVHTEVSNVEDQSFKTNNGPEHDPCANFTYEVDSTNKLNKFVKKMTIDYGTAGCIWEGRVRKGKIIITKTGKIKVNGTVTSIALENFSIDGNKIEGLATMENKGFSAFYSFKLDVTGGKITTLDGDVSTWETHRVLDTYIGAGTIKTYMRGTSSGVNHKGVAYSVTTTEDLLTEYGCEYIKKGVLKIVTDGKPDVNIDFGDGTCDNKATIIINGVKYKKTL